MRITKVISNPVFSAKVFMSAPLMDRNAYKERSIYYLIKEFKPKLVIETGIEKGLSTYQILKAMSENNNGGSLISIDFNEGVKNSTDLILNDLLKRNWKLIIGYTQDVLPKLNANPDIFIHDSTPDEKITQMEIDWAIEHNAKIFVNAYSQWINPAINKSVKEGRLKELNYPIPTYEVIKWQKSIRKES